MSIPKKPIKNARNLFRQIQKPSQVALKGFVNWVLRTLLRIGKRPNLARAGFALPTTMMVILVVALLTTTMVLRSFDRNRNAINARSEQVIQNSSTPAIDRANAKLAELLVDPELPRGTPPDEKLLEVMSDSKYTFGDETRLKVAYDFGDGQGAITGDGNIQSSDGTPNSIKPQFDETINTAWRYPVDTDGNGKFDAFTLYGLYWRNPNRTTGNNYARGRAPIEARSVPQDTIGIGNQCKSAGLSAAVAIEGSDWFKQGDNLSKAFYAYAATVPITNVDDISYAPFRRNQFEKNGKADKAFSGLEYQQDRYRSGLNNTAVWTDNDLFLNPGDPFRLNGKVFTNGNLLIGGGARIDLYQVSDPFSCFYEKANAQINVGGNVIYGDLTNNASGGEVFVHLFNSKENPPTLTEQISTGNRSTNDPGSEVAYNDAAYEKRISLMKQTALSFCSGCKATPPDVTKVKGITQYPESVQKKFEEDFQADPSDPYATLEKNIENYLRSITRRVPYAEVTPPSGDGAITGFTPNANGVDTSVFTGKLDPPDNWRTLANTGVTLDTNNLPQTNPDNIKQQNDPEQRIGDRVQVGNNLPALWDKTAPGKYAATSPGQPVGTAWSDGSPDRYRQTQAQEVEDVGKSNRMGYWELAAAADPSAPNSPYAGGGGLRAITGAGIYTDGLKVDGAFYPRDAVRQVNASFLPTPAWDSKYVDPTGKDATDDPRLDPRESTFVNPDLNPDNNIPKFRGLENILAWPDLMPMADENHRNQAIVKKGDLRMRATAVYHYVDSNFQPGTRPDQTPIACVSSYYDPTDKFSARNPVGLPDVSGGLDTNDDGLVDTLYDGTTAGGQPGQKDAHSNNGVTYGPFPGRGRYSQQLQRQARLVFPNGRAANQPLRDALSKPVAERTLADNSAIDAGICAIAILDGTVSPDPSKIPHGAFKESSFLDAREVKALDKRLPNDAEYKLEENYDLPLEERQPLEIRVTDIDLRLLAGTTHGTFDSNADGTPEQEYLLPNSGIIYASRDDAAPDLSGTADESATDFKLDSTRRPNGIRLINGLRLARGTGNDYNNKTEKGLILATNTPAYVKGHLNLHLASNPSKTTFDPASEKELEEFTDEVDASWSNFYGRGDASGTKLQKQFACRQGQGQGATRCTAPGDQWRPATILADAVTLQSEDYKEGYRNQGDFELSNILGSASYVLNPGATPPVTASLAGSRVGQGFFNNSFVTSAAWFNTTTNLPSTQVSYTLNGVTPVQRRANAFAYDTERCNKIPVSLCTAADWTEDLDRSGNNLNTARIPQNDQDQRFARRVAFRRAPSTNKYIYNAKGDPIPVDIKTARANALWFKTRENTPVGNPSFNATTNSRLFIFQPPEVPDLGLLRRYAVAGSNNFAERTQANIATPITLAELTATPPTAPFTNPITAVYNSIVNPLDPNTPLAKAVAPAKINSIPTASATGRTLDINALPLNAKTQLTGGGEMAVYKVPSLLLDDPRKKLTLKGDASSVFVFIIPGILRVDVPDMLELQGGVVPENVYWIVGGRVRIDKSYVPTTGAPLPFKGNVLAQGQINILPLGKLEGRALSAQAVVLGQSTGRRGVTSTAEVIAPDGNQPRLVPVTQLQSPDGTPAASPTAAVPNPSPPIIPDIGGGNNAFRNNWLQQPKSTNYNAAFVVGSSPDRPGESSAGLPNLVRFQENWSPEGAGAPQAKQTATIKGSFIQTRRSTYATAPYGAIRRQAAGMSDPIVTGTDGLLSIFDYPNNRYPSGIASNTVSYFSPPTRQWGFDVGLLSQTPDLFSQRFTENISKTQNYYRQVGRDDKWIQALLCAAAPANPDVPAQRVGDPTNGTPIKYNQPAVPDSERPNCQQAVGAGWNGSRPNYPDTL